MYNITGTQITARQAIEHSVTKEEAAQEVVRQKVFEKLEGGKTPEQVRAWALKKFSGQFDFQGQIYAAHAIADYEKSTQLWS